MRQSEAWRVQEGFQEGFLHAEPLDWPDWVRKWPDGPGE